MASAFGNAEGRCEHQHDAINPGSRPHRAAPARREPPPVRTVAVTCGPPKPRPEPEPGAWSYRAMSHGEHVERALRLRGLTLGDIEPKEWPKDFDASHYHGEAGMGTHHRRIESLADRIGTSPCPPNAT